MSQLKTFTRLSPGLIKLSETQGETIDYLVETDEGYTALSELHHKALLVVNNVMIGETEPLPFNPPFLVVVLPEIKLVEGQVKSLFTLHPLEGEASQSFIKQVRERTEEQKEMSNENNQPGCQGCGNCECGAEVARNGLPIAITVDDSPLTNVEGKETVAPLNETPKFESNGIQDRDVVEYDGVAEYAGFIREWAKARNIIGVGGSTTLDQFIKGLTEAGELWTHVGKGQHELVKDDLGDVFVCLVKAAGCFDIDLEKYITPTDEWFHSGLANFEAKGIKRYSLQLLYTLAAVAQAIEEVLEADNEADVESYKIIFCDALADAVYVLESIALGLGWSLTECVAAAYDDIKDRKGLMVNGVFVKEKDFTGKMINEALADVNLKEETKQYLREYLRQHPTSESVRVEVADQRAESISEAGSAAGETAAPATDAELTPKSKEPFWRVWIAAQGNKENLAPFDLTEEVCALLDKAEGDQFVDTLGVFGQVNHNHEVFIMDLEAIKKACDRLVGKTVGEINTPEAHSFNEHFKRIVTVNDDASAGVLVDYVINELGNGNYGPIIEVIGLIEPSAATKDRVATAGSVNFGIRSIVHRCHGNKVVFNHVTDLVCFDLVAGNPREIKEGAHEPK